jgi:serine/threonine-protein kinase
MGTVGLSVVDKKAQFGKHQILGLLGQGGMARVYLAASAGAGGVHKLVVIKELRAEIAEQPSSRDMFLDEARIATRLHHPNVVQTYEVGDDDDVLYLAMEYLEGQPLQKILAVRDGREPTLPLLVRILADTLAGLHYAHELSDYDGTPLRIVHRDVSPHNVFVTYDGLVKLVDFGVAKAADVSNNTASGVFKGKVRYAAPEQALGNEVDRRADVFAVGIMLWEMLAKKRMWGNASDTAILLKLANNELPKLSEHAPDAPAELVAICNRAIDPNVEARYESAQAMQADLLRYLDSRPSEERWTDLQAWIRESFASERTAMRASIDVHLKAYKDDATKSGSRSRLTGTLTSAASVREASQSVSFAPRRSRLVTFGIGAAAVVLVGGLVVFRSDRSGASAPPVEKMVATEVASSTANQPEAEPPARDIRVRLRAEPKDAVVLIDGKPFASNPIDATFPKDGSSHVVKATAEGYEAQTLTVVFDRDIDAALVLPKARVVTAAPTSVRPKPVAASPAQVREPAKAGPGAPPTRPKRSIDEDITY